MRVCQRHLERNEKLINYLIGLFPQPYFSATIFIIVRVLPK
jgi:hypothetical protein